MNSINFFNELGFTEYESKTLSSLTELKKATPKQISINSGVPQNKLYFILKKFQNLGILATVPNQNKKYELINIKTFISKKLKEKEKQLKQLKENSKQLSNLKNSKDNFSFSLLIGQKTVMNKLSEMNLEVKNEIFGVQRNWKYWAGGIHAMQKAIKKGVKVKLIGVINPETEKRAKEWKKIGCKTKKYNKQFGEFPLRFGVFDNKFARITIGKPEIKDPKDYITIWTDSKPLIKMLRNQFLEMWNQCDNF